jgi:hypothetical protein
VFRVAFGKKIGTCVTLDNGTLTCWGRQSVFDKVAEEWNFELESTTKITGFKRDLVMVDCICFAFENGNGLAYEVNEDDPCWQALYKTLESWGDFDKSWHAKVAHPAFAPCVTVLLDRTTGQSGSSG